MTKPNRIISEQSLSLDLGEASHALVRELAMAARKMAIYGGEHQLSVKAVEKPFFDLSRLFQFRPFVQFHLLRNNISVCGLSLKQSPFTEQLLQYFQALEISSIVISRQISFPQLVILVDCLVRREIQHDPTYRLSDHLIRRGVKTVEINGANGLLLFEQRKQYRGEIEGDYSVRRMASDQLGTDPKRLAMLSRTEPARLIEHGFDFDADLLAYLLPERVAAAPIELWAGAIGSLKLVDSADQAAIDLDSALHTLVQYHPQASDIGTAHHARELSGTESIRQSLVQRLYALQAETSGATYSEQEVADLHSRLLKTGGIREAGQFAEDVYALLLSADTATRSRALRTLLIVVSQTEPSHGDLQAKLHAQSIRLVRDRCEPFEATELLIALYDQSRRFRQWARLVDLVAAMGTRRRTEHRVTVFDSLAVKKAFEELQRPERIDGLVKELMGAPHDQAAQIRSLLIGLGSQQVAHSLAGIISHPIRAIRQQALKILAELGEASLAVFSEILYDDVRFEREGGKGELSDQSWYVVRNSIFVLGSIGMNDAIHPLRLRMTDTDMRVRREIISALEKIGGEDAVDLLTILAEDATRDIRDAAISAIGLIGSTDAVPLLINLVKRVPMAVEKAIPVIGKLGGDEAARYLAFLLDDTTELTRLALAAHCGKDDLRAVVVRALGQIGDPESIAKIKALQQSLSTVSQFLFPNAPVRAAIQDVLSRH